MKASDIILEFSTQFGNYKQLISDVEEKLNKMPKKVKSGFYVNGKRIGEFRSMSEEFASSDLFEVSISFIPSKDVTFNHDGYCLEVTTPQYKVKDPIKLAYLQTLPGYTELWLTDERTEELFDTALFKNFRAGWEASNVINRPVEQKRNNIEVKGSWTAGSAWTSTWRDSKKG